MDKNEIKIYATTEYNRWLQAAEEAGDYALKQELQQLAADEDELIDAFCGNLRFGTSGIRGIIGTGTNRMNEHVIRRTTQGLANYLNCQMDMLQAVNTGCDGNRSIGVADGKGDIELQQKCQGGQEVFKTPSIVIAYDSRRKSRVFAEETAKVLRGNNIKVYLFPELAPVSLLSYAIKALGCTMGIMITASHNPKIFNGYKVYNADGYQIVGSVPDDILAEIDKLDFFSDIKTGEEGIEDVPKEIGEAFTDKIASFSLMQSAEEKKLLNDLKVVYTPLNGTGNHYVRSVLDKIGFTNLTLVDSQVEPDENFTTCPTPNPEKITVYNEGFRILDKVNGDIIVATDPDCDRVGVCLHHDGMKVLLTGNQMGILMFDYLCQKRKPRQNQMVIKSIVSTPLIEPMAEKYKLRTVNTLTGFKYIGEIATALEQQNKEDEYFFAFEESNGYLVDPFIKDKDGVSAALMAVELAAYYKAQGKDLIDRLHEIYDEFGCCHDKTENYFFEGPFGKTAMEQVMHHFRTKVTEELGGKRITKKIDYLEETGLPKSNVLEYILEGGTRCLIRPSGTEAKIKVYYFEAESCRKLEETIKNTIEQFKSQ